MSWQDTLRAQRKKGEQGAVTPRPTGTSWQEKARTNPKRRSSPDVGAVVPLGPPRIPERSIVDLPAEISGEGEGAGFLGGVQAGFAKDIDQRARILAGELFPDEPIEQAIKRFGVSDGRLYYTDDEGQAHWALSDLADRAAARTIETLPSVAGVTTGVLTAPLAAKGMVAPSMLAAGGVGAATEAGRQYIGGLLAGDPEPGPDPGDTIGAGLMESLNVIPGAAIVARQSGKVAREVLEDRYDPAITANRERAASEHQVPLTVPETTGIRSLMNTQRWLSQHPATRDQWADYYARRDEAVEAAVDRYTTKMADLPPDASAMMTRQIVEEETARVKRELQVQAEPLYRQAYARMDPVDTAEPVQLLRETADNMTNITEGRQHVDRVLAELYQPGAGGGPPILTSDPQQVHRIQKDVAALLDGPQVQGEARTALTQVNRMLDTQLHAQEAFRQVDNMYGAMAIPRDAYLRSVIPEIGKLKDKRLRSQVLKTIFRPDTPIKDIENLFALVRRRNPGAAKGLVAAHLRNTSQNALRETQQGEVLNPAGKIAQAWGATQQQAKQIKAALPGREREAFDKFRKDVLIPAASVKLSGSDTFNNFMENEISREKSPALYRVLSGAADTIGAWNLPRRISDVVARKGQEQYALATTEAFMMPQGAKALREIQGISNPEARVKAFLWYVLAAGVGEGLEQAGAPGTDELADMIRGMGYTPTSDQAVPAPQGLLDMLGGA